MRRLLRAGGGLVLALTVLLAGCASAQHASREPSASTHPSGTHSARAISLNCPVTTKAVGLQAGQGWPLAPDPTGARACLTNEPASKRARIGDGVAIPADVAATLARLIDQATPASAATAARCAPGSPLLLTRFGYRSSVTDVIESITCNHDVAYIKGRAYVLTPLLGSYLEGATDPLWDTGFSPDVMAMSLSAAETAARRAGDALELAGELTSPGMLGAVLLQYPTVDHQLEVIVAVHPSPACRLDQIAIQYRAGGAGTGNNFGTILLRNDSGSWCELDGEVSITGLSASGRPVTRTINEPVSRNLELSPHAAPAVPHQQLPEDQLAASVPLMAEYRDDHDGSYCAPHWVVPKTWRLVLQSATLTVPNGRATANARPPGVGGLITCRGEFGAGTVQIATS